jgi:Zn-dependent protease
MDYQTTRVKPQPSPIQGVTDRLRMFVVTVMDLINLQSQLVIEDSKQAQRYIKAAGIALVIAVVILITALPMIGFGVVEWLVEQGWQRSVASLAFGATLTAVAAVLMGFAWKSSTRATHSYTNSRREAIANLIWIRDSIERQNTHE